MIQDTSREAFANAPNRQSAVLSALKQARRADWQLAELLSIPYSAVQSPRGALVKAGLVRDSGERVTTPFGAKSILWEAV